MKANKRLLVSKKQPIHFEVDITKKQEEKAYTTESKLESLAHSPDPMLSQPSQVIDGQSMGLV